MSSLAAKTTTDDGWSDDTIDDTRSMRRKTSDERERSIVATDIAPFDEGPESDRGGGGENAFPRGGADDDDAVVASDDLK